MFTIEFYELENGKIPVEEFINSLTAKMKVKAMDSISILQEYGTQLRKPYSKALGNGIFELRIKFSSDITRIFYFFNVGEKIILTNGYIKKTKKASSREIKRAKEYKADYERRHANDKL